MKGERFLILSPFSMGNTLVILCIQLFLAIWKFICIMGLSALLKNALYLLKTERQQEVIKYES